MLQAVTFKQNIALGLALVAVGLLLQAAVAAALLAGRLAVGLGCIVGGGVIGCLIAAQVEGWTAVGGGLSLALVCVSAGIAKSRKLCCPNSGAGVHSDNVEASRRFTNLQAEVAVDIQQPGGPGEGQDDTPSLGSDPVSIGNSADQADDLAEQPRIEWSPVHRNVPEAAASRQEVRLNVLMRSWACA
jgi:hypothetical protein